MKLSLVPLLSLALAATALVGCAASTEDATNPESGESDIVGGKPDARWSASGYLVKGPSLDRLDRSKPKCGATLIAPNVVVTAAHCVLADKTATWAFGTGNTGQGEVVKVVSTRVHPDFHETAQGPVDLVHALRKHDVATLVLEHAIAGVTPASLPTDPPSSGCSIQAIGYSGASRVSAPACIMFRITLVTDPIFEVHPAESSALCIRDGDEGSSVVDRASEKSVLRGIFVGSVTQGLTDCKRGTQFLDGYESMFGYRAFLQESIRAAAAR